jgi:hypothetical protein
MSSERRKNGPVAHLFAFVEPVQLELDARVKDLELGNDVVEA